MKEKLRKVGKKKSRKILKISVLASFIFTAGIITIILPFIAR